MLYMTAKGSFLIFKGSNTFLEIAISKKCTKITKFKIFAKIFEWTPDIFIDYKSTFKMLNFEISLNIVALMVAEKLAFQFSTSGAHKWRHKAKIKNRAPRSCGHFN